MDKSYQTQWGTGAAVASASISFLCIYFNFACRSFFDGECCEWWIIQYFLISCEVHWCIYHQLKTSFEKFCPSICLLTIIMIHLPEDAKRRYAVSSKALNLKSNLIGEHATTNWKPYELGKKTKQNRTLRWHLKVYFALWISSLLTLPFSSMPVITFSPVPLLSTLSLSSPADHNAAPLLDIKCFFFWDYLPISVVEVLLTAS